MGGGIQKGDLRILENLSFVSAMRGTDATGMAFGNSSNRDPKIFKVNGDPFYFNYMASDVRDIDSVFNNYFIGHTRFATSGDRGPRGAHPYNYGHITGAHNGGIGSYHSLEGFPTDSAKLLSSIAEKGLQATLDELSSDDAMALVWFDAKTKKMNFFRNAGRPLAFAIDHKNRVMYWYSEHTFLKAMLDRHGVETSGVYLFGEGMHFTFDPRSIGGKKIEDCYEVTKMNLPQPKQKKADIVHIGGKHNRNHSRTLNTNSTTNPPFTPTDGEDIGWLSPEAREALSK